ncbi:MAG: hypothetical protein RLZZ453_255 [Chlamydiota bacterium]|jgi:ectoine hydroxylase-related dioxygenase (phytanoyl-CoA dioxygenase family)
MWKYLPLFATALCFASTAFDELETSGFTVVPNVFSEQDLAELRSSYENMKAKAMALVASQPATCRVFENHGQITESRFWKTEDALLLQAGKGRYDLYQGFTDDTLTSPRVIENPQLLSVIQEVLKQDFTYEVGLLISEPDSSDQYWHRDVDLLSHIESDGAKMVALDDFYVTVLIPLSCSFTYENGTTEFLEGSHRLSALDFPSCSHVRTEVPLGSALVFNGKINHRGRANLSSEDRSTLYIVYHSKWYNDKFRRGVN